MLRQCYNLHTQAHKQRIVADEYGADLSAGKLHECWFKVIDVACPSDYQGLSGRTGKVFDFQQQVLIFRVYQEAYGRVLREQLPD